MSREIRADYEQQFLLPPALEDWVGEDHPARFIRDFVDSLDLTALGFRRRRAEVGRPNYAADLLLKVWIYGYLESIRSSRGLEKACREHMSLIWLTGNQAPDHNTLWRFWRENRGALKQVFRHTVGVAVKADLIGLVVHAVDGTKIASAGSKRSAWHREDLQQWLERLEDSIAQMEQEVEQNESHGQGEYRLPEGLREARERRQRIEQALRELEVEGEPRKLPTDPQARMMQCGARPGWAYNAQAVVDRDSQLVVAQEVTNEARDTRRLKPMLDEVQANVGAVAEENVADAGYESSEQFARAEQAGYEVLVSPRQTDPGPYHASRFQYDAHADVCICPQGEALIHETTKWNQRRTYRVRTYRCQSFRHCPVRGQCSRSKRGRYIAIGPYQEAVVKQREKRCQTDKQALLRQRKAIIEPLFAWIKQGLNFRRWTLRGLENVNAQWAMLCLTINLKKLYPYWKGEKLQMA